MTRVLLAALLVLVLGLSACGKKGKLKRVELPAPVCT